jgi:hypothetical protein
MRELFGGAEGGPPPDLGHTTAIDPRFGRDHRHHWTLQSALWRARLLAEAVFGGSCVCEIGEFPKTRLFQGLLELEVPFTNPEQHFCRERIFRSWAGRDPVIGQLSLVFVFRARPVDRMVAPAVPLLAVDG